MKGQTKALVPAFIGIITLLLTGITGIVLMPSEKQATQIAETRAITMETQSRQALTAAFRDGANKAVLQTEIDVAADLAVELKHAPLMLTAYQDL